jgi:stress-induced morphogen
MRPVWKQGLPGAEVAIQDLRGDGTHYAATVVCAAFKGLSRVEQHRMVFRALGNLMESELHALQLTTSADYSHGRQ